MFYEKELTSSWDLKSRTKLLASRGLGIPGGERYILGLMDEDGCLAATGSLVGSTIQGTAVDPQFEGQGLMTQLVSKLMEVASLTCPAEDIRVFTKAESVPKFADLGFHTVGKTDRVGLLEWKPRFRAHLAAWHDVAESLPPVEVTGSIVMNANPCTLGHEYLIRKAAEDCDRLFVFVVSEDRSQFSAADRLAIVKAVAADLPAPLSSKIIVMESGPYCISSATFPSYFTRDEERASVHAELDLKLFISQAKELDITRRYAGTEPFSPSTAAYNDAMARVLPTGGITPVFIPRVEKDGTAVSATEVRRLLDEGRTAQALALLPTASAELVKQILAGKEGA